MGITFCFPWEVQLMQWLQTVLPDGFKNVAALFTLLGEETVLIGIIGFLYWGIDKEYGKFAAMNIMALQIVCAFTKNLVLRRRPYMDHAGIQCLKPVDASADLMDINAQGFSCPSAHAGSAAAMYGSLAIYKKKKWLMILWPVLMLLVGFSRIYLGVHYPTDVLLGWVIGLIVLFLLSFLQQKIKKRWLLNLIILILFLPGWFFVKSNDFYTSYGILCGMLLGFLVEEKFVNFENSKNPIRIILRIVVGFGIYLGLNTVLKLPFSKEFLESGTFLSYLVRAVRYAVIIFILMAVYPIAFRFTAKIGKKNK